MRALRGLEAQGDYDAVFSYLDAGYKARSPLMAVLPQARHFLWRHVAEDARYERLLRRVGLNCAE